MADIAGISPLSCVQGSVSASVVTDASSMEVFMRSMTVVDTSSLLRGTVPDCSTSDLTCCGINPVGGVVPSVDLITM
jgi:hypothetical protein